MEIKCLITTMLFLVLLQIAYAISVEQGVIFQNDYNYTVNTNFNANTINIGNSEIYLDSLPYCSFVYKDRLTTVRVCPAITTIIQSVGGGGTLGVSCKTWVYVYNDCFYLDKKSNICVQGCPDNYNCLNYTCINGNKTLEIYEKENIILKTSFFQKLKNSMLNLFALPQRLNRVDRINIIQNIKDNSKNILSANPTLASFFMLIIIGSTVLVLFMMQFGAGVVFTNPIAIVSIIVSLIILFIWWFIIMQ